MRKILIVANSIVGNEPGVTGGESRFIELAKCWKNEGYEIHLMSGRGGETLCRKMGLEVILHKISNSEKITRLEIVIRFFKVLAHVPTLLASYKEGVVYSSSEQVYDVLPGFFLKLRRPKKIKFGVVVHWLPPALFWKRKNSKPLNSLLFFVSERLGLFFANINADALLPVSADTLKDLSSAKLNRRPTRYVLCGVNLEEIDSILQRPVEKKYDAVFMKRLQKTKGIFDLIEVWGVLVAEKVEARLLIIGEGVDGAEARKMVLDKGLGRNIEFSGVIYDPVKKFQMLASAKVFVLPSYEENWAIVIGEAMQAGLPVVCYDLKELRSVWEDNILYAELGSTKDLLMKLKGLLADDGFRKDLSIKAHEYVKKYSWKKIAETELAFITGNIEQ